MALRPQDVFSLVVLIALIQALQDGRITAEEMRNLVALILVASLVPQLGAIA